MSPPNERIPDDAQQQQQKHTDVGITPELNSEQQQQVHSVDKTNQLGEAHTSGSSASLSSVKRRGAPVVERECDSPDSGAKRYCYSPTVAQPLFSQPDIAKGSKDSSTSDTEEHTRVESLESARDASREEEEEEELSIDGSYVPSPLIGGDAGITIPTFKGFTSEEMEHVRHEAYELGMNTFLQEYIVNRGIAVRALLEVFSAPLTMDACVPDLQLLPLLKFQLVRFYRNRPRLRHINTIDDVVELIKRSRRIMVLTGAGVSVSCGIPDFRSPAGIYTRLNEEFGLDDPQQMFDIEYFRETPELFYSFAKELYPYNFKPAPSHAFVKLLEDRGKLLRNYTQNIDTLEHVQGIKNVLNCHGSFATATCIKCGYASEGTALEPDIMAKQIAYCPRCKDCPPQSLADHQDAKKNSSSAIEADPLLGGHTHIFGGDNYDEDDDEDDDDYGAIRGIMKPDITFFGEKLPAQFDEALLTDREEVDLLLVMGSSLKVAPVSDIMGHLPHSVPQIVINKTPILHFSFDVQLLGNADDIVAYLAHQCGWELQHARIPGQSTASSEFKNTAPMPINSPPPFTVPVRVPKGNDGTCTGNVLEKELAVPEHWHLFPSAVVTGKDLMVANGEASVRLAVDSDEEYDGSELDNDGSDSSDSESDTTGQPDNTMSGLAIADANDSDTSEQLVEDINKAKV
ncbi:NAD-dependent histone deacetylase sir2 [Coemansia sp. RSA 988]|nr:NAD-dependent histone deacetylase sir2 [Coemansia sp. RSA 988]